MPSAAASTFEVATAQEPCSASSTTWTALSGPIDSALRIDSVARSGPMVRMVTSPPCASLIFSASSMAYSSISLMTLFAEPRSTVLSSRAQVALRAGVGHLLDEYDDVHRSPTPVRYPVCYPVTLTC